jgi:hypothetical protein
LCFKDGFDCFWTPFSLFSFAALRGAVCPMGLRREDWLFDWLSGGVFSCDLMVDWRFAVARFGSQAICVLYGACHIELGVFPTF